MFLICARWSNMTLLLCTLLDVYSNKLSFTNDICELKQDEMVDKSFVFIQKNIDVFGMDEVRSQIKNMLKFSSASGLGMWRKSAKILWDFFLSFTYVLIVNRYLTCCQYGISFLITTK